MTLAAAVCQFSPTASAEQNRARIAELTGQAAGRGASLVVFPEYSSSFVSPFDATLPAHAEPLDGPFTRHLRELAATYDLTIVAGLLETGEGEGLVRNTAVAVDAGGIRARYRKQHLYDAFGETESAWVEPGELQAPETFDVAGLRVAMMTCYDLRFPEVARTLIDAGADVIVVPSEWVRGPLKEHHWATLLAARAIENTAFVVAADHPAPIAVGHSQILSPEGVVLAGLGAGEGVALAHLERTDLDGVRAGNPALRLRRYRVVPGAAGDRE